MRITATENALFIIALCSLVHGIKGDANSSNQLCMSTFEHYSLYIILPLSSDSLSVVSVAVGNSGPEADDFPSITRRPVAA